MKRYIFILMMCCLFTIPAFFAAHAQKIVQAQGTASIMKHFVAIARDRAIEDAQRLAVEQAVGVMISNETLVENYQVIGKSLSIWVAVWLPATELLLGLMLILGLWPVAGLLLNAGLMTGFLILVSQAWIRGLDIECGCYGSEGSTIGLFKVLQNIVLAGLSIWLWIRVRACEIMLEKSS